MILHFTHLKFLAPKYIMVGDVDDQPMAHLPQRRANPLEGYKLRTPVLLLPSLHRLSVRL